MHIEIQLHVSMHAAAYVGRNNSFKHVALKVAGVENSCPQVAPHTSSLLVTGIKQLRVTPV